MDNKDNSWKTDIVFLVKQIDRSLSEKKQSDQFCDILKKILFSKLSDPIFQTKKNQKMLEKELDDVIESVMWFFDKSNENFGEQSIDFLIDFSATVSAVNKQWSLMESKLK